MRLPRLTILPVLVSCLALAGCGEQTDPASGGRDDPTANGVTSGVTSGLPSDAGSDEPSAGPDESTSQSTATTSAPPAGPASLRDRLLPADELPGVNQETVWTVDRTGGEGGEPSVTCQRFALVDIGAEKTALREYDADGDVRAVQLVGAFADEASAARAHEVVKTWVRTCADLLDDDVEKVGTLRPADVPGGSGESVVVQHGDTGAELHTFTGLGISQVGPLLSVVEISVEGMDYNYEPGQEPAALAVVAAAGRLT